MPANMLFGEHHRVQLAHRLNLSLTELRKQARRAADAHQSNDQLTKDKDRLVSLSGPLANVDVHRETMYRFMLLCMFAVYGVDLILFAAVAGYFAKQNFSGRFATVAQFLVPAFIVVIEMALSMQRDSAYRDYLEGFGTRLRLWAWTTLTALCTLVMPAAVVATFLAGQGDDFSPWVSIPLIITLAGLSLVCHVLMLCGGRLALESKSWALFRLRMSSLQSRVRQSQSAYQSYSRAAADRFSMYLQDLNTHNSTYPDAKIEAGPFDKSTREVLNEAYGYEVIRTPATSPVDPKSQGQPPRTQPASATPSSAQQPSTDSSEESPQDDAADWRNMFERQMRDQEAEVRP
jgi:hypothetical protein